MKQQVVYASLSATEIDGVKAEAIVSPLVELLAKGWRIVSVSGVADRRVAVLIERQVTEEEREAAIMAMQKPRTS